MTLATLFVLCRFVHFTAVMLMFGIGLFTALLSPQRLSALLSRDLRPWLAGSTLAAAVSAVALLAVQAGLMGDGWQDTYQWDIWLAVLGTTFGEVWRWHLALSLCALAALWLPLRLRAAASALLGGLLLISMAFIGHAAMHSGLFGTLHRLSHALHLLAAGYWFGSLLPLLVCLRYLHQPQWRAEAVTTLIRFSRWGHLAVAVVLITGVLNGLMIVGGWPLDISSPYQRLLLIKSALVLLMVGVALTNRYAIVPALHSVPNLAQRGVILACWSELALGGAVLLLVSLFATYAPNVILRLAVSPWITGKLNQIATEGHYMKRALLALALLAGAGGALAAEGLENVTKLEFGKQWAFTKEEVTLQCRKDGALFVLNNSTLMQYPLNDIAQAQVAAGQQRAQPLATILLDDVNHPGEKMSVEPFRARAQTLCAK